MTINFKWHDNTFEVVKFSALSLKMKPLFILQIFMTGLYVKTMLYGNDSAK